MDKKVKTFGSGNVRVLVLLFNENPLLLEMFSSLNKNNLEITIFAKNSSNETKDYINAQRIPFTCVIECNEQSSTVEGSGFTFKNLLTKVPSLRPNSVEASSELQTWYLQYYELPYIRIGNKTPDFVSRVKDLLVYLNGV